MLLAVLVALDGRAEWLTPAAASYLTPSHPFPHVNFFQAGRIGYGTALAVVAAASLARRLRRSDDPATRHGRGPALEQPYAAPAPWDAAGQRP